MAKVEFRNVEKIYPGGGKAVTDFSLRIEDGEFLVLVGPSGCGKSTLMRMLAGLESVSAGQILLADQVANEWTPQQRNVAMVFQDYALYPHMSVRENLAFPLRMRKLPAGEVEQRVAEVSALLDLQALSARLPAQLSGGQRQRVAMGRALVRDPSVFLLDEPLSNLDARLRAQIRAEIAALRERVRKTTLYVTHDQVEAMTLGDRVCVINQGVMQQVGTPLELYRQPANTFVAGFLGSPGMNLLPVQQVGDRLSLPGGQSSFDLNRLGRVAKNAQLHGNLSLGVRPEVLQPGTAVPDTALTLRLSVHSVEALGHENLVYARLLDEATAPAGAESVDGQLPDLVVRLAAHFQPGVGEVLEVHAPYEHLSLFDQAGQRIN